MFIHTKPPCLLVVLTFSTAACGYNISDNNGGTSGAIEGLTDGQWTFVQISGAKCRDGSSTGVAVNPRSASANVMIYLAGGGACFNMETCEENASTFGAADFDANAMTGILSRTDTGNPFSNWNLVYIPYCTGDVHSGNAKDVKVKNLLPGQPSKQQFVGYNNMTVDLESLVATFPDTTRVMLAGESAGGFGAAANFEQTARAFSGASIDVIDDSGPLMRAPYIATCLQQRLRSLYGWDKTVIGDCGADCDNDNPLISLLTHLGRTYPQQRLGLIDSTADAVIATFFGFGADDCSSFSPVLPDTYEAGLDDIRTQMAFDHNFGAFLFAGFDHTSLTDALDTRSTNGVKLSDWVSAIRDGSITNVGPPDTARLTSVASSDRYY